MARVKLIRFFAVLRKNNKRMLPVLTVLLICLIFPGAALPAFAQGAAGAQGETGKPCSCLDSGDRAFGTDDKSGSGFSRDPESGDLLFKTPPPPEAEQPDGLSGISVTPEIRLKKGLKPEQGSHR